MASSNPDFAFFYFTDEHVKRREDSRKQLQAKGGNAICSLCKREV
jgi:hypothetical protein